MPTFSTRVTVDISDYETDAETEVSIGEIADVLDEMDEGPGWYSLLNRYSTDSLSEYIVDEKETEEIEEIVHSLLVILYERQTRNDFYIFLAGAITDIDEEAPPDSVLVPKIEYVTTVREITKTIELEPRVRPNIVQALYAISQLTTDDFMSLPSVVTNKLRAHFTPQGEALSEPPDAHTDSGAGSSEFIQAT